MKLVVAASGGVAAIKTPALIRRLQEAGHELRVAATEAAFHFVTPLSLAVATGSEVFDQASWFKADGQARHIELARWADALVIAPATADALASAALGKADDVISALCIAGIKEIIWVPAMNTEMWQHPLVQNNVATLKGIGHHFLGPASGNLAAKGEAAGVGRMLEPEEIVAALPSLFKPKDLAGKHVLVSAGPTREYLDPVRFISNPSSGKMGYAVAEAALARGAKVTLVTGPSALTPPSGSELVKVESALEMLGALQTSFAQTDILVMTAAVADWRAKTVATEKQPKMGDEQTLELIRTPDILSTLKPLREKQIMVGFAMETDKGVERAADKASRKGLDFICLNYPTQEGTSFGGDDNQITVVRPDGNFEKLSRMSKRAIADIILDKALDLSS
ncbi:MAG: bifunctional phosphopantothenoylcysteine decarboxylase/phosphopantothenate--cysteine ligase CoaBC [Trueperaceae bacterium]|nr:bifunctional phosphopantothenoylcysteine decarboxylase/phosphopantothenate--cysteine ligase CoaBC [Trueperaceae bacterium]